MESMNFVFVDAGKPPNQTDASVHMQSPLASFDLQLLPPLSLINLQDDGSKKRQRDEAEVHDFEQTVAAGVASETAEHIKPHRKYTHKKRKVASERKLTRKETRQLDKTLIGRALNERKNSDGDLDCGLVCAGCRQMDPTRCQGTRSLDVNEVFALRKRYVALLHERERTLFIKDLLLAANALAGRRLRFELGGTRLCEEGFRLALGISRKKLRKAINLLRSGAVLPPVRDRSASSHAAVKADAAFGFLRSFFDSVCDDVPSARGVQRIMTMWRSWPHVYQLFRKQFEAEHAASPIRFSPPSFTVFERVRLERFANVVRPKKGTQPTCTVCVALSAELERCDSASRPALLKQMHAHTEQHQTQRRYVQSECDRVLAAGGLVVRSDHMSPAQVPHYKRTPKVLSRKTPLDLRVFGVYVQGSDAADNGLHLTFHLTSITKDANSVATALHHIVTAARLPSNDELLLSFDNAVAEGKNVIILMLCVLWVSFGWFRRVRVLCLLPGHAHNYLDALYSHLQRALRSRTIASLADIVDACSHAFTAERLKPHLHWLLRAWDWRSLLDEFAVPLAGHSVPLGFLIERVPSLPVDAPARLLGQDISGQPWLGLERTNEPVELLRGLPRLPLRRLALLPVAPTLDRDALVDCMKAAHNHKLLHDEEKVELLRIVEQGTPGITMLAGSDTTGYLVRPGSNPEQRFELDVIDRPPASLQPPPPPRAPSAPASASKPAVPLFFEPRVGVLTHRPHKLKQLREEAAREQAADGDGKADGEQKAAPAASPASSPASASASALSTAAASATPTTADRSASAATPGRGRGRGRGRAPPASPTRFSPRRPSPARSPALLSPVVSWDNIDDEMDEDDD